MVALVTIIVLHNIALTAPGDWPEPRQNSSLTAVQPLPGNMAEVPVVLGQYDLGKVSPSVQRVKQADGTELGLVIVGGALHAFASDSTEKWVSHPPGLNYLTMSACEDLDGDGEVEVLLQAGRPGAPYGAAVLMDLETGAVRWRYDVEPMSYAWYLHTGNYIPDRTGKQIIVLMHGYPPDKQNGYIVLFAPTGAGNAWEQQWRYDFHQYTCFPSLLQSDYDNDGVRELAVETHSRMWFIDPVSGQMEHFESWDVAPANMRSYGLVEFADLNGDDLEDFLCIADFAQHHEVLLNKGSRFERAWLQAWGESVTTGNVATAYPKPAYGDLDGDGALEIVASVFNGENESAWCLRVYDAATGTIEHKAAGLVPVSIVDADGDGMPDITANRIATSDINQTNGACVLGMAENQWKEKWNDNTACFLKDNPLCFEREGIKKILKPNNDSGIIEADWNPPSASPPTGFDAIPALAAATPPPALLLADLGRVGNELLLHVNGSIRVLKWEAGGLVPTGEYKSLCPPVIADLDGDDKPELVCATLSSEQLPVVEAVTPALKNKCLWRTVLPVLEGTGLPNGQTAYMRTGRFTGGKMLDIYVWFGTPRVRSVCIEGTTGRLVWEHGEHPEIERHWGPSINLASVYDYNKDSADDLVFTNPDYYCIADGRTGNPLLGPLFPPKIFNQPSQGLYTLPAILAQENTEPLVALVSGHYFQAAMTMDAAPLWYSIPETGQCRIAAEGFLPLGNNAWLMGFGRQNGMFAAVDVFTGTLRWELPVEASCTDTITCDVDKDQRFEFVFATSHGELWAVGDDKGKPRVVWHIPLDVPAVGSPIVGEINNDGASEIALSLADGRLLVLGK